MQIIKVSPPTKEQIIHGAERTLMVFVLASVTYLKAQHDPLSKAAWIAAGYAGVTAVYQLLLSTLTTQ